MIFVQLDISTMFRGIQGYYTKFNYRKGFPCNQFGSQEPGSEAEIQNFCRVNFGVTFPMFSKINVNGENTHPLYQYLKSEQPGILGTEAIKWNFTKFLVDKEGHVVERFGSSTKPSELEDKIEALLK